MLRISGNENKKQIASASTLSFANFASTARKTASSRGSTTFPSELTRSGTPNAQRPGTKGGDLVIIEIKQIESLVALQGENIP